MGASASTRLLNFSSVWRGSEMSGSWTAGFVGIQASETVRLNLVGSYYEYEDVALVDDITGFLIEGNIFWTPVDNLDLGAFMMAGGGAFTGPITGTTAGFSGAVTGASYSGGPISGTTGTFSGNVSAPKFVRTSSRRYKRAIRRITPRKALRLLMGIQFVEYDLKGDGTHAAGVIAEKLAGTELDYVVKRDARGRPDGVDYEPLFVLASTALQGLATDLAKLKGDVATMKTAKR